MAEMMGYSLEELFAIPVLSIFDPEDLPLVTERRERVQAGQRLHFTQVLRRSDGSTFVAEVNTTPLFNQAGRYDGAVALVSDVTEHNKIETQRRLRASILDSIGEAVTASTADGIIVYVNPAAERLFGWRAADVIGKQSYNVFPAPEDAEEGVRILALLQRKKGYSGRYKMARPDGSEFMANLTAAPVLDDHHALVGFVGVVSDQTERDKRDGDVKTRERQAETLALLGSQALRQRVDPLVAATLIVSEAVEATRRLLQADQAMVLDLIAEADELEIRAASPQIDERVAVPSGSQSFAGYLTLARKVVVVDNVQHDRRFDPRPTQPGGPTGSAIGAPIFGPEGLCGVLIAESSTTNRFDHGDAHFIQGMANIIGTALLT
jgi:PAS domain S-box-containing protein